MAYFMYSLLKKEKVSFHGCAFFSSTEVVEVGPGLNSGWFLSEWRLCVLLVHVWVFSGLL